MFDYTLEGSTGMHTFPNGMQLRQSKYAKGDVVVMKEWLQRKFDELDTAQREVRGLRSNLQDSERYNRDLSAKLEAAEAQLKYEHTNAYLAQFRVRDGGVYDYNPKTRQVMVDSREFQQLHAKATAYRYNAPGAFVGPDEYARPFSVNFHRDTIEVPRSSWEWLNNSVDNLKRGRMRFAEAIGAVEGEDIAEVANQVKTASDFRGALLVDIRKSLGLKETFPIEGVVRVVQDTKRTCETRLANNERIENENTDLRSTLRQMNRTAQNSFNTIANLRETLRNVLKSAEDVWHFDYYMKRTKFKGYDAAESALKQIKTLINAQLATGDVGSHS